MPVNQTSLAKPTGKCFLPYFSYSFSSLLYANTASRYNQQIPFGGGQSFPNQFGMNQGWGSNPWDMSNPSACQSVLIQGIAALILAIIVGLIACYIVFTNSPTRPMAGGLSFLTALLTILLVAMTANVMAGLIYTCAPFGTVPGGSFCTPTFSFAFFTTTSVGTVQTAIVFGWIASACMLFLALLAAYWVGISFRRLTFFTTTETEKY